MFGDWMGVGGFRGAFPREQRPPTSISIFHINIINHSTKGPLKIPINSAFISQADP
jgi:hypothetical protein